MYGQYFTDIDLSLEEEELYLERLYYTLAKRRSSLQWKSFTVAGSMAKLSNLKQQISKAVRSMSDRKLGFIFTGQGAQWPQMGQELLDFPTFKNSIRSSETVLESLGCSWSIIGRLDLSTEFRALVNNKQRKCRSLRV